MSSDCIGGCILKVELSRFTPGLDIEYEGVRGKMERTRVFRLLLLEEWDCCLFRQVSLQLWFYWG